ncbi:lipid A biosynthesis lauroyl acyltransferase [Sulfurimonas sp. ST-27]|uniref:lipid A biosynthesis lauroyl acyltransferase n=1 Tax=Sulfurimonas sp. ST-27 TaxID=3400152 RepID=UPI003AB60A4D
MGYNFLLVIEHILMLVPHKARKAFFTFLAFIGYKSAKKYRRIVRQNLNYAFDNSMSDEEIDTITRYSFKNLLYNFLHLMEMRHLSKEEIAKRITVINKKEIERIHKEDRAVIYVTPHYCAWELGAAGLALHVEPIAPVYKKLKNRIYEKWLLDARARFGNTNLEKTNVVKPLIRLIKQGKASGILIDTNINEKEGVMVEFMGKPLRMTATPAYLARKFNAAIVPVHIRTDDEENYTIIIADEIKVDKTENEKEDIQKATQLQADWLTSIIKKEPKFWFWLHRRWKNDKPEIYT